jgi:hypothetical protein
MPPFVCIANPANLEFCKTKKAMGFTHGLNREMNYIQSLTWLWTNLRLDAPPR